MADQWSKAFAPFTDMVRELVGDRLADTTSILTMFDEAVIVEHPFTAPQPRRFDGIAAIRDHMERMSSVFDIDRATATSHHECDDGSVTVAEFSISGRGKPSGDKFDQHGVLILKTAGGYITHFTEYWNPTLARPPSA